MLLIQNGRVLDPWTGTDAQLDVLIGNDGVIAKIAEKIDAPADCKIFDAAGLTVSPGFVDGHVHFRDPGQTQKEDVLTGAAAAAAGGYATRPRSSIMSRTRRRTVRFRFCRPARSRRA